VLEALSQYAPDPPFGAVIVIWPELPSAMQSGVSCARTGRRGTRLCLRHKWLRRRGPGLPVAAAVEPVADLLTEGLMSPG
jgi:hypothetical protein